MNMLTTLGADEVHIFVCEKKMLNQNLHEKKNICIFSTGQQFRSNETRFRFSLRRNVGIPEPSS